MACANSNSTGKSFIGFRSGETRLTSRLVGVLRAVAEWLAREQLRHAGREIDARIIDNLAASDPDAARELRKLFGL